MLFLSLIKQRAMVLSALSLLGEISCMLLEILRRIIIDLLINEEVIKEINKSFNFHLLLIYILIKEILRLSVI
jgi:hypothetical protein